MDSAELRTLVEDQLRLSRKLRARIRELEQGRTAPLAIVGMALRFPGGVTTPEEYWDLLSGPESGICDIPEDRPGLRAAHHPEVGRPGRSYVGRAGFLRDVAGFDAGFFGISTREAEALDPQQRLLLETAWEALERAGIAVRRADRLDAGVFVGIMAAEYGQRLAAGDPERLDPYFGTGGGHCFAAGRISYALGLRGPAVSLDTACSSSLVALHTAARSLRTRECRYALVAGANLLFSPQLMVSLCQSRALAPDGRSKPFTAAADGYGRGEGVATVVLMRLDDAVGEGRPVLAVLRGTAVNHDGASSGLTVPNGPAQREVIGAALRDAGVSPAEVSYVEAHGTGTSLGDPIEAAALEALYGADGRTEPLLVSSVKARLGHLEAAAGMAGLIKLVLMLRHEEIVADVPEADGPLNPMIPWSENHLEVPRRARPWTDATRTAGISAFGLSGTNAHAIIASAPPAATVPAAVSPAASAARPEPHSAARPELLVLSARTGPALRALAASVSTHLFRADPRDLPSLCHTLRAGRAPLPYRLAVTGASTRELARAVSLAAGGTPTAAGAPPRTVLLSTAPAAPAELGKAVAAIAADLPVLTVEGVAPDVEPAAWLAAALDALGVPVKVSAGSVPAGHTAALECRGRRVGLVPDDTEQATAVFLAALAALYLAGADLRMERLREPGARFLSDLPTYPFQRERFWIDEPDPHNHRGTAVPPGASAEAGPDAEAGADAEAVARFLRTELAAALKSDGDLDLGATFAELGGDSFTAMLFVRSVEDRYQAPDIDLDFTVDQPLSQVVPALARTIAARSATARQAGGAQQAGPASGAAR